MRLAGYRVRWWSLAHSFSGLEMLTQAGALLARAVTSLWRVDHLNSHGCDVYYLFSQSAFRARATASLRLARAQISVLRQAWAQL